MAPPPAEVAEPAAAPEEPLDPVALDLSPSPVPGEFEIEEALDPVHEALVDAAGEPTLFDDDEDEDEDQIEIEPRPVPKPITSDFALDTSDERDADVRPFAQEFADAEEDEKEVQTAAPIEDRAVAELPEPVYAAEEPMFSASEPEPDHYEPPEPARSPFLPVALGVVLGMLLAFPAGYFLGSRDRLVHN